MKGPVGLEEQTLATITWASSREKSDHIYHWSRCGRQIDG